MNSNSNLNTTITTNPIDRRQTAYEQTVVGVVGVMKEFGLDRTNEKLTDTLRRALSGQTDYQKHVVKENEQLKIEIARLRHIVRQLAQLI